VSIRFYSNLPAALALLAASLWTTQASAQASAPEKPIAPAAMADAAPPAYRSALEGYQPYTDEKEARQAQTPDAAAKPDPHAGHAKP